jgi:curved DNA-binding protein CbpA
VAGGPDPYKVLQVDPEAEDEVIQAAYRRLAQKYHPDRAEGSDAIARMVAINAAWELIGEPQRRAAYDRSTLRVADAAAGPTAPASQATGRTAGRPAGSAGSAGTGPSPTAARRPETVSTDWTSGRSTSGGGYDAATMRAPEGLGAAGPPPGNAAGSVLNFGRYAGWSLGEISRRDIEYIEWLDRVPIGRPYREEVDVILRRAGRRKSAPAQANERRGLFRRR